MMNSMGWADGITTRFNQALEALLARVPDLAAALLILLAGLVIAWLLSRLAAWLVRSGLGQLGRVEWFHSRPEDAALYRKAPAVARSVMFWAVLLLTLVATLEVFDLAGFSAWAVSLAAYVPRLLAGLLLIFLGFLGGDVARNLVDRAASRAGSAHALGLSRGAQILVALIGVILGIEQLGIASTILTVTLAILAAGTLGAAGLAFGLGARSTVANLLAVQQLKGVYEAGDSIRVGEVAGRVVEMTQTTVVLETEQGRVSVPGQFFSEQMTTRLTGP